MNNREIKFRAWIPSNIVNTGTTEIKRDGILRLGKMYLVNNIRWSFGGFMMFGFNNLDSDYDGWNGLESKLRNGNLMQFTGFLDKNGKEIYCQDIVRSRLMGEENEWETWVIEFSPYSGFVSPNGKAFDNSWIEHEVLGNVFENSNLLQDNKQGE